MSDEKPDLRAVAAEKSDTLGQDAAPSPDDDTDGLSSVEMRFIDLSASAEFSMEEIAAKLGVTSRTLRRWKARPAVASQIRTRTAEAMSLARAVLAAGANRAARELVGLAETAEPDHARIAACVAVVSNAAKLGELQELSDRLAELETRIGKGH
jgi:transposase-like protein